MDEKTLIVEDGSGYISCKMITGDFRSSGDLRGGSGDLRGSSGDLRGGSGDLRGSSVDLRGSSGDLRGNSGDIDEMTIHVTLYILDIQTNLYHQ